MVDAIGVWLDEWAYDQRAKVKEANFRLARQGDPSGLMSGDRICADEPDDSTAPTAHRAAKSEFEVIATAHVTGRDRSSDAWREVPIIERMRRQGQITQEELLAAQKLHRDFARGMRTPSLTVRYQPRIDGSNGTPIAQQCGAFDPHAERLQYLGFARQALKCLPPRAAYWIERIVCQEPIVGQEEPAKLEDHLHVSGAIGSF
jgi:hypothetical protein